MDVRVLTGADLDAALGDVAGLRITVFREWPYLYDGDLEYERRYLQAYRERDRSILVGAFDGGRLVGASTGAPLADNAQDFAAALDGHGFDLYDVLYCPGWGAVPGFCGQ